jgi:hypothetical protein
MTVGMPDTGARSPAPIPSPSHVSTTEWQSFEVRMRRRRAERLMMRAEVALEAGFVDQAREALDEARQLDSSTPSLEALRERVGPAPEPAAAPGGSRRWVTAGAACLLMGVAAFGGWSFVRHGRAVPPQPEPGTVATRDVMLPASAGAAADSSVIVRTDVTHADPVDVIPEAPAQSTQPPEPEPAIAAPRSEQPQVSTPPVLKVADRPDAPPVVPVTTLPPPVERAVPEPPLPPAPLAAAPPATSPAPAPPPAPAVDESARVRSVLSQYESAYSRLDARAARTVWPAVDERALSRAFEGLQAQRLSLGLCDVSVNGATAKANCAGTASWTPKVGSGKTEARRWDFTLQNADGTWQIVRAQTR